MVATLTVPLIVNDRADIALMAGAAGVHLGADDVPVAAVRSIAPPGFIIGTSAGNEAELAGVDGADYVGIGPAFLTPSKSDAGLALGPAGIARLAGMCGKPAVAIGGIDATNVAQLAPAGVRGVAVIAGIFSAADAESAARAIRSAMSWLDATPARS
jgi:thiamine-phosphate pyrophosphorylase